MSDLSEQMETLQAAVAALESQRATLGDAVVEPALAALRKQLDTLDLSLKEAPSDERKVVTILFADISGFTALAEKEDPENVRELINSCFGYLVPVVARYGGTIDKFMGDGIMALFGAPIAHEDDAERALRTALEMMAALETFNRAKGTTLGLHVGINTGRVIAGQIGSQHQSDYSVMGDAVNLAARLEDASSDGEIFVGSNTYQKTEQIFEFEAIPALALKGKEEPVPAWRLRGLKSSPARIRGHPGLQASLIGRDAELRVVNSVATRLQDGKGGVIAIIGEAGLGKSRLLREARSHAEMKGTWIEGRALPYTAGENYFLAREVLCSLVGLTPNMVSEEDGSLLLLRSLTDAVDGQAAETYPFLARLLDLPLDENSSERIRFVSPEALQAGIVDSFCTYVQARAERRPLVLVWEDLHWCDPSSLRIFEALLPLCAETPILLICALRPDDTRALAAVGGPHGDRDARIHRIELSPLTRPQSAALVRDLLHIEDLPASIRDLILDRAEGNPFFLEELLQSLMEEKLIVLDGHQVRITADIGALEIPETIEAVIAARLDRLAPANKHTLQRAAVIGRIFERRVLARLDPEKAGEAAQNLDRALAELQRREFIYAADNEAAADEDNYSFKHAITHSVTYESLLLARRRELHRLVAEIIETLWSERLEEMCVPLAYHYERGDVPPKAVHYLVRAAERARTTFANTEAINFYQSALQQLAQSSPADPANQILTAQCHEHLADVLTLAGKHEEARAALRSALASVAESYGIARSRLFRKIGYSHSVQHQYEESARAFDAAEMELKKLPPTDETAWWEEKVQIQLERLHLLYWQGMAEEMRQLADSCREIVEKRATAIQLGKFFLMLALSLLTGSRYRPSQECVDLARRGVAAIESCPVSPELAHIRFVLGLVLFWKRNFEEAMTACRAALAVAEKCGDLVVQARCLAYLTSACRCAGEITAARNMAVRTHDLAFKLGMLEYMAIARANLSWVEWREGNHDKARQLGEEALRRWHSMEDPYGFDWMALWPLIAVAQSEGDIDAAVIHLRALFGPNQHPLPDQLSAVARQTIAAWEKKDEKGTIDALTKAMATAHEFGQL
jgi:class 3 adenylate cyclase/tetratricopeptide (TPR) repeat protein